METINMCEPYNSWLNQNFAKTFPGKDDFSQDLSKTLPRLFQDLANTLLKPSSCEQAGR